MPDLRPGGALVERVPQWSPTDGVLCGSAHGFDSDLFGQPDLLLLGIRGPTGARDVFIATGQQTPNEALPFIGVTTSSTHGIVDTAAQEGLIGKDALLRLFEALRSHGLRGRWTGKTSEARGIGGKAATVGVVQVPVGLGGVPGVLELAVVADNVPLGEPSARPEGPSGPWRKLFAHARYWRELLDAYTSFRAPGCRCH